MSSKEKRRSNSVEQPKEEVEFDSNRRMFKSSSNQNFERPTLVTNGLKGKSSVFNRPGTIAALSALSLGGFSQNISANTLRNSHSQWSFAKADRFKKLRIDNSAKMLLLPSTLGGKVPTFGYGNKKPLQIIFGKDSPAPNLYRSKSQFEFSENTGKSFGISYSYYK